MERILHFLSVTMHPLALLLGRSKDVNDCGHVCKVLQLIGPDAAVALPQVREILRLDKPFGFEVYHALHAVARMGDAARPAEPEVRNLLNNPNFRSQAAAVLARLDPSQLAAALHILQEELTLGGQQAAKSLRAAACLGSAARDLLPEIRKIAGDPQSLLNFPAKVALAAVGDPAPVVQAFIADLLADSEEPRLLACEGLVLLQKSARKAAPALEEAMKRDQPNRMYYAGAIYEITRKRPSGMIRGFNNLPNGYPW